MTWTPEEAAQEELIDPTVRFVVMWCAFCAAEYERNPDREGYRTCPACHIGPMSEL